MRILGILSEAFRIVIEVIKGLLVPFLPYLLPLIVIFVVLIVAGLITKKPVISFIISYYVTSFCMSAMALVIYYFPNKVSEGFKTGYILADFITLDSILDWVIKLKSIEWGITYDWIIVSILIVPLLVVIIIFIIFRLTDKG